MRVVQMKSVRPIKTYGNSVWHDQIHSNIINKLVFKEPNIIFNVQHYSDTLYDLCIDRTRKHPSMLMMDVSMTIRYHSHCPRLLCSISWKVLGHPPHSLDLSPCDFRVSRPFQSTIGPEIRVRWSQGHGRVVPLPVEGVFCGGDRSTGINTMPTSTTMRTILNVSTSLPWKILKWVSFEQATYKASATEKAVYYISVMNISNIL